MKKIEEDNYHVNPNHLNLLELWQNDFHLYKNNDANCVSKLKFFMNSYLRLVCFLKINNDFFFLASICMTYESGPAEFDDFPQTDEPVHILGHAYSTLYGLLNFFIIFLSCKLIRQNKNKLIFHKGWDLIFTLWLFKMKSFQEEKIVF